MKTFCILIFSFILANMTTASTLNKFTYRISPIPKALKVQMKKYTWHPGCPVSLTDLVYLKLSYWGFDNKTHSGFLIVNKELVKETVAIFKSLYQHQFPIQRMELMEQFKGDDNAAMKANNTSSFNCRQVTGQQGLFSQHSYGRAIDINTLVNPYVKGNKVLPPQGAQFAARDKPWPGKITRKSLIYKEFTQRGWDWAGNWYDVQDYQHFEKRANGEKRNLWHP